MAYSISYDPKTGKAVVELNAEDYERIFVKDVPLLQKLFLRVGKKK